MCPKVSWEREKVLNVSKEQVEVFNVSEGKNKRFLKETREVKQRRIVARFLKEIRKFCRISKHWGFPKTEYQYSMVWKKRTAFQCRCIKEDDLRFLNEEQFQHFKTNLGFSEQKTMMESFAIESRWLGFLNKRRTTC